MKKICKVLLMFLCVLCMAGCGERKTGESTVTKEYLVINAKQEDIVYPTEKTKDWQLMSMQYYQGELVQFWAERAVNEELKTCLNIHLGYGDGTSKLLMGNVATKYNCKWFVDETGEFYLLSGNELIKLNASGEVLYRKVIEGGSLQDICRMADGQLMLLVAMEDHSRKLCALERATGAITIKGNVALQEEYYQTIAADAEGLMVLDSKGIWRVDVSTGVRTAVLDFEKYAYALDESVEDFKVLSDGRVELAQTAGVREVLHLSDISESKIVIVVRDDVSQSFMPDYVAKFNVSSEKYFVTLEQRDAETNLLDYIERTGVEIGTGGGPDILFQDVIGEPESLIAKGALVDMCPYLEQSGMNEEDYFPAAFDYWRDGDKIYGVNMLARTKGVWISEELLGSRNKPTIEALVDALLAYQEKAMFKSAWESDQVLDYFLSGSADLWGMIDWESNTCDFDTVLFDKMLQAAMEYGYDPKKDYPTLSEFTSDSFYKYQTAAQYESEGKVYVGYIFEDGCYPSMNQTGVMAINANSDEAHRQGAWEFIKFLLSEEVQVTIPQNTYPVNKEAFEIIAATEIAEGSIVTYVNENGHTVKEVKTANSVWKEMNGDEAAFRAIYDLTEEKVDEIRILLNSTRALPINTADIRLMICEEAMSYFSGGKSKEEVIKVIENRVQLYLNEKK